MTSLAHVWLAAGWATCAALAVPIVRQAPERCGPAALAMVLRYYRADSAAIAEADRAYDPVLRGALVTDLAASARRAGFDARVATPGADSLERWVAAGVPPIVLYQGRFGPVARGHYGVVVGFDRPGGGPTLHDGGPHPARLARREFVRRWMARGGVALLVTPRAP